MNFQVTGIHVFNFNSQSTGIATLFNYLRRHHSCQVRYVVPVTYCKGIIQLLLKFIN